MCVHNKLMLSYKNFNILFDYASKFIQTFFLFESREGEKMFFKKMKNNWISIDSFCIVWKYLCQARLPMCISFEYDVHFGFIQKISAKWTQSIFLRLTTQNTETFMRKFRISINFIKFEIKHKNWKTVSFNTLE